MPHFTGDDRMTTAWTKRIKSWLVPSPSAPHLAPNVPPGIYHYQCERDSEYIRFHLRIEPNGEALLIAGASEVARLSRVGAEAAKRLLDAEDRNALVASIKHPNVQNLYREVTSLLDELGRPNSRFPIFNLSDPIDSTRDAKLIAPFQADVEIGEPEKLHAVLRRLWDAGIPHVRLLHAPTVRTSELVRAAEHAEDIGMIAGVRALANWLHPDRQINQLAEVGLDYVVCPWGMTQDLHRELFGAEDYEALPAVLEQIRQWEMTPVVELPLVAETTDAMIASMQQ